MKRQLYYLQKSDRQAHPSAIFLCIGVVLGILEFGPSALPVDARKNPTCCRRYSTPFDNLKNCPTLLPIIKLSRGGATSAKPTSSNTKKTKTKKKSKSDPALTTKKTQEIVDQKLKEKDAAQALGDAIRERAHALRFGGNGDHVSPTRSATRTLESVGYALGASDYMMAVPHAYGDMDESDASIDEQLIDPAAVIVQYFLKSHGGAHALQCICSLFATIAGIAACFFGVTKNVDASLLQLTFIKRCMMFAIWKHASGLVAAAYAAASTIPTTGFQQAVAWMQTMSKDPVSQYVFYAAAVFLWLPSTSSARFFKQKPVTEVPNQVPTWWQAFNFIPLVLVGPVVIREFISTALVATDVLVLIIAATSSTNADGSNDRNRTLKRMLLFVQTIVDSIMSIIVTPQIWRSSTALQRQAIMAKLTSKISLTLEIAVGILMTADALFKAVSLLFLNTGTVSIPLLIKTCILAHLYLQFLWTRRKKIAKLASSVRGGALGAPLYLLDVLLDPTSSMGIPKRPRGEDEATCSHFLSRWRDFLRIALDMDE
jgi:hypothetical protein